MILALMGGGGDIPNSGIFEHFSQPISITPAPPPAMSYFSQESLSSSVCLFLFSPFLSLPSICIVDNCNLEDAPLNLCPLPPLKAPAQFNKANTVMAKQLIGYRLKCNIFF